MQIKENVKLAPYTTFKIGGPAKYFCEAKDQFDALEAFEFAKKHTLSVFILGGGSNLLVSDDGFDGLVVRIINTGIEVLNPEMPGSGSRISTSSADYGMTSPEIYLKVASGENWDKVVEFAVSNNWWGLENLSHIPGSTGAIAVQNVGAYGQEAKNVIESVTVFDTQTHQILTLENKDCGFEYRKSIFNSSQKGRYIIFYITFKLSTVSSPILSYRDLSNRFTDGKPLLFDIRKAVIEIRDKKFPFPTEAKKGNAGSFFKNLILTTEEYLILKTKLEKDFGKETAVKLESKKFVEADKTKVPTAFLLDLCGLKDLQEGGAAINHNQPLVIINKTGESSAKDVINLAKNVKSVVLEKLGVNIHIEPELLGFKQSELNGII
jgi:UDP-N-acetylmuramate dehydrogenase